MGRKYIFIHKLNHRPRYKYIFLHRSQKVENKARKEEVGPKSRIN